MRSPSVPASRNPPCTGRYGLPKLGCTGKRAPRPPHNKFTARDNFLLFPRILTGKRNCCQRQRGFRKIHQEENMATVLCPNGHPTHIRRLHLRGKCAPELAQARPLTARLRSYTQSEGASAGNPGAAAMFRARTEVE